MASDTGPRVQPGQRTAAGVVAALLALSLLGCSSDGDGDGGASAPSGVVLSDRPSTGSEPSPSQGIASPDGESGGAEPVAATVRDPEAEVEAEDQSGNGNEVKVEEVELSSGPGHLVVLARESEAVLGQGLGKVADHVERSAIERARSAA